MELWSDCVYRYPKPFKTMGELRVQIGTDGIFEGTDVDEKTRAAICDYFENDHLCANDKMFLWLFRRELWKHYPIYQTQLAAWAERTTLEWLHDLRDKETKIHYGHEEINAHDLGNLKRVVSRAVSETINSEASADSDANGTKDHSGTVDQNASDARDSNSSTTGRAFNFGYPESNYTGGVIPYDLKNTPSVEFIDTQADALSSTASHENGSSESNTKDNYKDNTNDTAHSESSSSTDRNTDDNETATQGTEGNSRRLSDDNYTDTFIYDRADLENIIQKILNTIPMTNFFEQLIRKLDGCFMHTFIQEEVHNEYY